MWYGKGRKFTKEWKENLSKAHMGHKHSEETRKKMSATRQIQPNFFIHGFSRNEKYRTWQKQQWAKRKKAAGGGHTFGDWEDLKAKYNWTCPCCHKSEPEIKLTEDHIIPLSKGGSNNIENIQPLCLHCNCSKHDKIIKY